MMAPQLRSLLLALLATILLSACASSGGLPGNPGIGASDNSSRVSACKSTDTLVDNSNQCLQDDAACYELSNGKWCTGERGNSCPAGSTALPTGQACPPGSRCFHVGESLECTVI
ncbi:hypothetical protein [Granulosicoccus antarcticus]|uniref:Lipoprotein n=1 Tax=Granulosicoccus antarcticus IMCC3135 TaxID=1192854 RepID=A0A2Z2NK52_9GAMM|nr:hypothetical protein [Granulosicoccus antarcticus]ASJ71686.1 hypothetical protein IMCC3135_07915 [Granulosicoccus antarcticus IMCC3135]